MLEIEVGRGFHLPDDGQLGAGQAQPGEQSPPRDDEAGSRSSSKATGCSGRNGDGLSVVPLRAAAQISASQTGHSRSTPVKPSAGSSARCHSRRFSNQAVPVGATASAHALRTAGSASGP